MNAEGTGVLIVALETPEMMNKLMLEQKCDSDWPNGILTNIWEQILADELPNDGVVEMEMDDDLRNLNPQQIRIPRNF